MTATNHVVTGAVIGAAISNPVTAVPLAFMAHFALDALPHFGMSKSGITHTSRTFLYVLAADMALALAVLLAIVGMGLSSWLLLAVCGIACASPDLMWFWPWVQELRGQKSKPAGWLRRFHARIQWGERPWGIAIELIWFIGGLTLLGQLTL